MSGYASDGYYLQKIAGEFTKVNSGELAGSATAVRNPSVKCTLVKFKAASDNAGNVYIGNGDVTVANGVTDTTTGWPLAAGEESPWLQLDNVNRTFRICDNAGDDCFYVALDL